MFIKQSKIKSRSSGHYLVKASNKAIATRISNKCNKIISC